MILESQEIQFLRKLMMFAIPSTQNACFCNPGHPNSNPKIIRKNNNLKIDMKNSSSLVQKKPKSSQNWFPKSTKKIDRLQAWTSQGPPGSNPAAWNKAVTLTNVRLNSGAPLGNPENLSIFEPVSKATKAMKIGPKATQNHEKMTLESQEIQFL